MISVSSPELKVVTEAVLGSAGKGHEDTGIALSS